MEEQATSKPPPVQNPDLSFLSNILKLADIALTTPFYEFKNKTFPDLRNRRYCAICVLCVLVVASVYSMYGKITEIYPVSKSVTLISTDFLSHVVSAIFHCVVVIRCYVMNVKVLGKLFAALTTEMFADYGELNNNRCYVQAAIFYIIFGLLFVLDIYLWYQCVGMACLYHLTKKISFYVFLITSLLIQNHIKILRRRFKICTALLINLVNKIHKPIDSVEDALSEELKRNQWVRATQTVKPDIEEVIQLRKLSDVFDELFDSIEYFNSAFGWKIALMIAISVVEIMQALNFTIAFVTDVIEEPNLSSPGFLIMQILWACFVVVSVCLEIFLYYYKLFPDAIGNNNTVLRRTNWRLSDLRVSDKQEITKHAL